MDFPCVDCPIRKSYAVMFDVHFSGASCPYECDVYEKYKEETK